MATKTQKTQKTKTNKTKTKAKTRVRAKKPAAEKVSKTVSYRPRKAATPIKGTVLATVAPNASLRGVIGKLPKEHQEGCNQGYFRLYQDCTSFERYIVYLSTEGSSQRRYVVASRAKLTT